LRRSDSAVKDTWAQQPTCGTLAAVRTCDYQPATALWEQYSPETAPRDALRECIGFQETPHEDPEPEQLETVDRGDYIRKKITIATAAHTRMPVYLLLPKSGSPPTPRFSRFTDMDMG
jgi:hypothetical protein